MPTLRHYRHLMDVGEQLAELEEAVVVALECGDTRSLPVVGFGELSVALALGENRVAKRMPPFSSAEFDRYRSVVGDYCAQLEARGVDVVETDVFGVSRGDQTIGYLVQPRLEAASLGESLLRSVATPVVDHPVLCSIGEAVGRAVDERVSIDAQVTNWSLTPDGFGELRACLLDVGTPLMWDATGAPVLEIGPFLHMLPTPARRAMGSVMTSLMERWKDPEGVLVDALANLHREGLAAWVEPAATTWGRQLGVEFDLAVVEKAWTEDKRLWPLVTRLKRTERWWRRRRGEPYEFFIQTTFGVDQIQ